MNYKGYELTEGDKCIIVEGVRDFDPVHTFECGQCFRWERLPDGSFTGIVKNKVINLKLQDGIMVLKNTDIEDFKGIWFDYFDLGRNYTEIKKQLSQKDEYMKKAVEFGWGIRILRQDIWETLISFIISANNRIPMIIKVVAALSQMYGKELNMDGDGFYSFPEPEQLAEAVLDRLQACRGGFRCKYISDSSKLIREGVVELDKLVGMNTADARCMLELLPGVGKKVADCTLLYSGTKYDVFPTDVWVKRVMEELYFKREASFKEIQDFAAEYFGELAGFAQQYLFYYARENKIGVK